MGQQAVNIFTLPAKATAAVAPYRCISFTDAHTTSVGQDVKGISMRPAAIGEAFEVACLGTAVIESGGAISVGAPLICDAIGRVTVGVPASATITAGAVAMTGSAATGPVVLAGCEMPQHLVGYALEAATAAGQFIEVKLSV